MTDTYSRLEKLATVAEVDPRGLKAALKTIAPDWIPQNGSPGVPNTEYTKARETKWRLLAVMVAKVLTGREVHASLIREIASFHKPTDTTRHDTKDDTPPTDFVTLRQCAGLVNKSKRQLERWKTDDPAFPTPEIIGGDGKADEWSWATIRPYLEGKADRKLPAIFPAHVAR